MKMQMVSITLLLAFALAAAACDDSDHQFQIRPPADASGDRGGDTGRSADGGPDAAAGADGPADASPKGGQTDGAADDVTACPKPAITTSTARGSGSAARAFRAL
jgi:hypothetical protein